MKPTPNPEKIVSKFVPLISSGTAGPLGVLHLPRFWLKASLEACGKLDSRYPGCGLGYDQMTLNALGLNRDAVLAYLKNSRPNHYFHVGSPCGPSVARAAQVVYFRRGE